MCGIIGYLDKRGGADRSIGQTLLAMLNALSCRGPDSAGVAVFHDRDFWHVRVSVPTIACPQDGIDALNEVEGVKVVRFYPSGEVFDAMIAMGADPQAALGIDAAEIERRILERLPTAEVICLGSRLNLSKQVGSPEQLEATYHISKWTGTHAIGHTRLSTESKVDLSHSQPFWAHGVPDLATVHNGHITNYHKLRRQYEQRDYRFYTENDSEIIGIYLRDRMAKGMSLADALRSSLDDFDGSFSYLAATGDCLAYVKDRFGFKPLMVAETDTFVAIATEEIALRKALGRDFVAKEPAPGSMRIWNVQSQPVVAAASGK